jgi:hypothetical protein
MATHSLPLRSTTHHQPATFNYQVNDLVTAATTANSRFDNYAKTVETLLAQNFSLPAVSAVFAGLVSSELSSVRYYLNMQKTQQLCLDILLRDHNPVKPALSPVRSWNDCLDGLLQVLGARVSFCDQIKMWQNAEAYISRLTTLLAQKHLKSLKEQAPPSAEASSSLQTMVRQLHPFLSENTLTPDESSQLHTVLASATGELSPPEKLPELEKILEVYQVAQSELLKMQQSSAASFQKVEAYLIVHPAFFADDDRASFYYKAIRAGIAPSEVVDINFKSLLLETFARCQEKLLPASSLVRIPAELSIWGDETTVLEEPQLVQKLHYFRAMCTTKKAAWERFEFQRTKEHVNFLTHFINATLPAILSSSLPESASTILHDLNIAIIDDIRNAKTLLAPKPEEADFLRKRARQDLS